MADLMRWEMRDPADVLQSKQEAAIRRSCKGCAHTKVVTDPFGGRIEKCVKGRPIGKRCGKYEVHHG